MVNENTIRRGNVILVEPNSVNVNNAIINGIPQYQDMYIFAELTAESKGRTVIINGNATSTKSKKVNFMGNDQNKTNNPNYLNFTTNYYEGSVGNKEYYEGFGINSIKIVINSSFIPQVSIQFVDVRGLAFFNQKDSPYRMLFDFPPPIFTLIVKGYYGRPLTYKLHLVKYTSEFSASNGNFIIDAQFVAMTFAPLTDILFRYVVNAPLIDNKESMTPITGEKPRTTFELIMKLKNLYAAVSEKLETDVENLELNNIRKNIETIQLVSDMLTEIIKSPKEHPTLSTPGDVMLIMKTPKADDNSGINPANRPSESYNLTQIERLSQYNELIKGEETSGIKQTLTNRILIGYKNGANMPPSPDDYQPLAPITTPIYQPFAFPFANTNGFNTALSDYKKMLIANKPATNIVEGDIQIPQPFKIGSDNYYWMDITDYYYKAYKANQDLNTKKDEVSVNLALKINNLVAQNLGMLPSIYNIFDVILKDVDTFFNILRKTSKDADTAHGKEPDKTLIIGNIQGVDTPINKGIENTTKVYPFPLVIKQSSVYGGSKQERIAPIELQEQGVDFPELTLVTNFIDTFLTQNRLSKQYDLRANENDDGSNKWIPISPFDSVLGGASPASPYININDDITNETLKTLIKRFYILSQGTIDDSFYNQVRRGNADTAYVTLYAKAEAANVVSTISTKKAIDNLKTMVSKYNGHADQFYKDIAGITDTYFDGTKYVTANLYDFKVEGVEDGPQYLPITPASQDVGRVYLNKLNSDFQGIHVSDKAVQIQDREDPDAQNPVDTFTSDAKKDGFFKGTPTENAYKFTQENVIFIPDDGRGQDDENINGLQVFTRYLFNAVNGGSVPAYTPNKYSFSNDQTITYTLNKYSFPDDQMIAYNQGNLSISRDPKGNAKDLKLGRDYIGFLWQTLSEFDTRLMPTITGTSDQLSQLVILSNFGNTMGPFNNYPNKLNNTVFNTPAAIEVPAYWNAYVGMLVDATQEGSGNWENKIITFFTTGAGSVLPNRGYYVLADLHDIKNYLSVKDKEVFRQQYNLFIPTVNAIALRMKELYDVVQTNITNGNIFVPISQYINTDALQLKAEKQEGYRYFLNPTALDFKNSNIVGKGNYFDIIQTLIKRGNIINYSQRTFRLPPEKNKEKYESIESINNTQIDGKNVYKTINDEFFQKFFSRLDGLISNQKKLLEEQETQLKKAKGDVDIITQLYYSFKNINDKWLTGSPDSGQGYPFNNGKEKLLDSFAFVDRGMNPIGETMINAEILTQMLDDPNISLFSVLSQLLSLNGFEFFPLQNFMRFDSDDSWESSFKMHTGSLGGKPSPFFVCMYIGGSSSYPSVSSNGFENDGIIDISEPGVSDFSTKPPEENLGTVNDLQERNIDFPWRQVRAFRVRFGEQAQSMFTDIKIDSKEYPETNESIQILSRLAGDNNPDAPVPKGQNLYNLYENRSYKATITGFGNAMIQPTQYFQLENVPMFNGAYIILSVEHNITANKMVTSFSGTKLLKYPIPRVLSPVAFTTLNSEQSGGDAVIAALNLTTNEKAHFNAMYANNDNTLKIQ